MGEGLLGSAAPCIGTVVGQTKPKVAFATHRLTRNSTHDSVYKRRMGLPPMTSSINPGEMFIERDNSNDVYSPERVPGRNETKTSGKGEAVRERESKRNLPRKGFCGKVAIHDPQHEDGETDCGVQLLWQGYLPTSV